MCGGSIPFYAFPGNLPCRRQKNAAKSENEVLPQIIHKTPAFYIEFTIGLYKQREFLHIYH